jgi:peptide subunit release factor 1 (eRF1)
MLNERDLQELLAFRPAEPVLSVYLNVDPSAGSADAYRLQLRQLLKEFAGDADGDVEHIQRYTEHEFNWSGRSLALFSCQAAGFFRAFAFSVPVRSRARRIDRPYVKPLADLLASYGDYGVVLVDKQGARLFHFHLGELQEQEGTLGEAVRHTKRGGASTFPGRRGGVAGQTAHAEELTERNLKQAAKFAASFFEEKRVRRVAIGGTAEVVAHFVALLPKRWQTLVFATFPMEMTASHSQVLAKALAVGEQGLHAREAGLIESAITAAAKGQDGVVRLDETLHAVHDGRVQTLLVSEGFRAPGYRCTGCHYVTSQRLPHCSFCGGEFEEIADAVELAVRRVMADGGEVEVIHGNPRLEQAGRIAGLLRY